MPGVMTCACHPSSQKAKAGEFDVSVGNIRGPQITHYYSIKFLERKYAVINIKDEIIILIW